LLEHGEGAKMDGVSRVGWLQNPRSIRPESIVVEWTDAENHDFDGRSLVTPDGLKLNVYRGDRPELYALKSDPGELRNVASQAQHRATVSRLADELRAWQAAKRDAFQFQI